MSKFAKGTKVQQVVMPLAGEVVGYSVDGETGKVLVCVEWQEDGTPHSRYFAESELELTPTKKQ
jgi:hypothetical protein